MPAPRALLVLIPLAIACGGTPTGTPDAGNDGGDPNGPYEWDLPEVDYEIEETAPFDAPEETWTFIPVPGSRCGNGTSTGMAVNRSTRSNRLLLFLAGGGACWEAAACAAGTAVNLQRTMGEAAVLGEARSAALAPVFDRENPDNPFRDASFVYIPYCTGDLHGGTKVHTYEWFGPREVHHTGATNMHHYLRHLRPTFRDVERVWLGGVSAGGFGATLHWWRVQKALPWARVDVFNDSGLVIDVAGDGRYGTMQLSWDVDFPPGCSDCSTSLSAALDRSVELLPAPRRYAVLGYERDQVIGNYFGLNGTQVETRVRAMRDKAASHLRTFLLEGTDHVVYDVPSVTTSTGLSAREWSRAFAEDDEAWDHAGP